MRARIKFPKGGPPELPHIHPDANHWMFGLSGKIAGSGDQVISLPETYVFAFSPKGVKHGPPSERKFLQDSIALAYFDGPHTRVFE